MKYKYKLSGLDCPKCAGKIEDVLNKEEFIDKAVINFSKLTLVVESELNEKEIKKTIVKIIKKIEPSVVVLELSEKNNNKDKLIKDIFRLFLGILLLIIGFIVENDMVSKISIILSYIVLLMRTGSKAIKLLLNKIIDENLLVTLSCVGAYLTNNIKEGLMVIILYEIGKLLENIAVNNSRKSISDLMDIKPEYANLLRDDKFVKVSPEDVNVGDVILIKQGEKIPLDGIVVKGDAKLNTSSLTGESKLLMVNVNDKVLSGTINVDGLIEVKVTNVYQDSTVSRILNLVETAEERKAKLETFVSKGARIYTPTVLILAILVGVILPLITNLTYSDSLYRALTFLVISCPCAIAISVPLSYFSGIGIASREGILIKGSDYLDLLRNIKTLIFDKTGTITSKEVNEYKLEILDKSYEKEDIIKYYVSGEILSNHPIAKSILCLFSKSESFENIELFKELSGKGIIYKLGNQTVKIGSSEYCESDIKDSAIYLNIDNLNVAKLTLFDGIKENVKETIRELHNLGINTMMYTGDSKEISEEIASMIGIDKVYYELLPEDKYKLLEEELNISNNIVGFVGDGINDAPVIALANVGISMGSVGSQSAIEASDVVIVNDDLDKVIMAINISKYTNKIIRQNLIFAIGTKLLVLILSVFGLTSMWQAVFADTGVTLLTILNTTRIFRKKY